MQIGLAIRSRARVAAQRLHARDKLPKIDLECHFLVVFCSTRGDSEGHAAWQAHQSILNT